MDALSARRQKFVEQHLEELNKMQAGLFKSMETVIVDKKTGGSGGITFLTMLKSHLSLSRETSSGMESADRLKYAQSFFDYMKNYINEVMNDPGYKAVLKDIDTQMKSLQEEIRLIDEEIKKISNEKEKERLLGDRRDTLERAA